MNPPFHLGRPNPFSVPALQAPSYQRLELSAGATFSPGDSIGAETNATLRLNSLLLARLGAQSNFVDQLSLRADFGVRIQIADPISIDFTAVGGISTLYSQVRSVGIYQEDLRRNGVTANIGLAAQFNGNITDSLGLYLSALYQREFCADVDISPNILPTSHLPSTCEDGNIFRASIGLRWGLVPSNPSPTPDVSDSSSSSAPPERYNFSDNEFEETRGASTLEPGHKISEILGEDFKTYVDELLDITHLDRREMFQALLDLIQNRNFAHLSPDYQRLMTLVLIHDHAHGNDNAWNLLRSLSDFDASMTDHSTANEMIGNFRSFASLLPLPLQTRTLSELERLINNAYQRRENPRNIYARAKTFLSGAYLNQTLNPYARNMVREFVEEEANRHNISLPNISNFNPTMVTVQDNRINRICNSDENVDGCATIGNPLHRRYLFITHRRTEDVSNAFEVLVHENMHLFSARAREERGIRNPNDRYWIGNNLATFPFWLEEALNEENVHTLLRRNNLFYHAEEAHSNGREAIIQINQRHSGSNIEDAWRILHLFGSADPVYQNIGRDVYRRLTIGYARDDSDGQRALTFVQRHYGV